jgi:tryptophan synthase alpha subunit
VIVGSAIVKRMEERVQQPEQILTDIPAFLASLRAAMDQATVRRVAEGGSR